MTETILRKNSWHGRPWWVVFLAYTWPELAMAVRLTVASVQDADGQMLIYVLQWLVLAWVNGLAWVRLMGERTPPVFGTKWGPYALVVPAAALCNFLFFVVAGIIALVFNAMYHEPMPPAGFHCGFSSIRFNNLMATLVHVPVFAFPNSVIVSWVLLRWYPASKR